MSSVDCPNERDLQRPLVKRPLMFVILQEPLAGFCPEASSRGSRMNATAAAAAAAKMWHAPTHEPASPHTCLRGNKADSTRA